MLILLTESLKQQVSYIMKTAETQTQQFIMFLAHEDKLTKLYQRIKSSQNQKQQLANKIQYLEFKIKALEKSLFQQQFKNQRVQSSRNQVLIRDVIELEQELNKQKKEIKKQRSSSKNEGNKENRKLHTSPSTLSRKQMQTLKLKDFKNMTLRTIKQQSQMSNQSTPFSTIELRPQRPSVNPSNNSYQKTNITKLKRSDQIDQMSQRIQQLQKLVAKQVKSKKILEVENKRLRKANEQFNSKCKRLQKLVDARQQLYNNIHQTIGSYNLSPFQVNGSYIPTEFNYEDKESLFQ